MNERMPDCLKCMYFKVSWDPRFPRSCVMFNVKTKELPSAVVLRSTGVPCPSFRKNPKIKD